LSGHRTARVLIYTHRWLGIALGVLFVVWFTSGIVMIYARMPELSATERLARLPAINPSSIREAPPASDDVAIARLTIGTLEGRPVYRISAGGRTRIVFADTGGEVPLVDADQATRIARAFEGGYHAVRYDARLTDADQWSFGIRGRMPVHRIAVDDPAGTVLYVAEAGGDVLLKTNASGRFWGWTGAVLHWIYFTPIRRNAALWNQIVVWLSIAGTLTCLVGIAWGAWRWSPLRGYRLRREQHWSPYAGWMRWHHYAGLIFGVVTTTWIFSGLLSMDPWDWHPGTTPTREQRQAVSGGAIDASTLSVPQLRAAIQAYGSAMPKEIEIVRFRGAHYATSANGIVSFDSPAGVHERLPESALADLPGLAMPGIAIENLQWLNEYDAYYYDRGRNLPLPVLRAKYIDPQRTWLYFDPRRAAIVRKEERLTRLNRWLYHGLHSLDFPFLYYKRPLWDIVVIVLSLGGLVLSATTLTASWRRVRRAVTAWGSRS
jgi:hypothetical protein